MIKLSQKAYNDYRNNVNGSQDVSFEYAEMLLNRNIILGDHFKNKGYDRVYYGCLMMIIKDNTIIHIKNRTSHKGKPSTLAKKILNELMGIGK